LFVVVTTDDDVIPYQVSDSDLVSYEDKTGAMYVAVVYNISGQQRVNQTVVGDRSHYQYNGMTYYNALLMKNTTYYSFVRAYSFNHTESVSVMIIMYCAIICCYRVLSF